MVSYDARLFLGKPRALMFVHEIPLPGFISKHSEVLKQLQGIHLRNNWFSSLWGHVRIIIVVYVIGPASQVVQHAINEIPSRYIQTARLSTYVYKHRLQRIDSSISTSISEEASYSNTWPDNRIFNNISRLHPYHWILKTRRRERFSKIDFAAPGFFVPEHVRA